MTEAERRELHDLVERYAQAVDRADGKAVAELFADDGVLALWMDPSSDEQTGERVGHEQIATVGDGLSRYVATHHTISSHTSVVDGMHANGETLCTAHHVVEANGKRTDKVLYLRYLDTFTRTTDGWRFARRELYVQWQSTLPVD
ncbi:MAG TPA: nuclear transport factor 2 family protein [Mycobacteriales bacterium]|nr:nuclear transport factor 2 family protein [Mycobacteriales bacterium]